MRKWIYWVGFVAFFGYATFASITAITAGVNQSQSAPTVKTGGPNDFYFDHGTYTEKVNGVKVHCAWASSKFNDNAISISCDWPTASRG